MTNETKTERLARLKRELSYTRAALAAATTLGAPQSERSQHRASIRRLEDDIAAAQPREKSPK